MIRKDKIMKINKNSIIYYILLIITSISLTLLVGCFNISPTKHLNTNSKPTKTISQQDRLLCFEGNKNDVKLVKNDKVDLIFVPGKKDEPLEFLVITNNLNLENYFSQYTYVLNECIFNGFNDNSNTLTLKVNESSFNSYCSFNESRISNKIKGRFVVIKYAN